MDEPLYIGIDGGGTNCRARIADAAGNKLGEGTGGPANVRLRLNVVLESILAAIHAAAHHAGLDEMDLERAHAGFGLAGAALAGRRERLRRRLENGRHFSSIEIGTDAYATWLGAYGDQDGAILIHGTGSCGLAVVDRKQHYISGYGSEISDEASAMMLGREAIRRALWAKDGRQERTPLADYILEFFDENIERIIKFADRATPADYGQFAPKVFEFADVGDPLAQSLVQESVEDATCMINLLVELGAPSVYLHGGMAASLFSSLPAAVRVHVAEGLNEEDVALKGAVLMARLRRGEFPPPARRRRAKS